MQSVYPLVSTSNAPTFSSNKEHSLIIVERLSADDLILKKVSIRCLMLIPLYALLYCA